jgi:hypothetical protein
MDAYFNIRRNQRNADACNIFGLWMSKKDLKDNIKDFGNDDKELKELCEIGLKCYAQNKDLFEDTESDPILNN